MSRGPDFAKTTLRLAVVLHGRVRERLIDSEDLDQADLRLIKTGPRVDCI